MQALRQQKTVLTRPIKLRIFTVVYWILLFFDAKPRHPSQDWIARNNQDVGLRFEATRDRKRNLYLSRLHPGRGGATFHISSNQCQFPIFRKWSNRNPPNFPTNKRRIHGHQNHLPTASSIFQLRFKKARGKHIGTKCQEAFHTFWAIIHFLGVKTTVPT